MSVCMYVVDLSPLWKGGGRGSQLGFAIPSLIPVFFVPSCCSVLFCSGWAVGNENENELSFVSVSVSTVEVTPPSSLSTSISISPSTRSRVKQLRVPVCGGQRREGGSCAAGFGGEGWKYQRMDCISPETASGPRRSTSSIVHGARPYHCHLGGAPAGCALPSTVPLPPLPTYFHCPSALRLTQLTPRLCCPVCLLPGAPIGPSASPDCRIASQLA